MGLFLQKLEKSLRLSTHAHVVDLPPGDATGREGFHDDLPARGPVLLSAEQQVLVDVLQQLFKIRDREEAQRCAQRKRSEVWWTTGDVPTVTTTTTETTTSRASPLATSSSSAEFLNEFVKVVAVCQALLSQREGEASVVTKRKRKLDCAWPEEQKARSAGEEAKEREEDLRIEAVMAHLHKRAKLVIGEVCEGACCDEHTTTRQGEAAGHTADNVMRTCEAAVDGGQGCIVSLVRQVAATMVAASRGRNKRRWAGQVACAESTQSGEEAAKKRRTHLPLDGAPMRAERKRKFGGDHEGNSGAVTLKRARNDCEQQALFKSETGPAVKRKRLGIAIIITPADH